MNGLSIGNLYKFAGTRFYICHKASAPNEVGRTLQRGDIILLLSSETYKDSDNDLKIATFLLEGQKYIAYFQPLGHMNHFELIS